jgi:hypothetical protein
MTRRRRNPEGNGDRLVTDFDMFDSLNMCYGTQLPTFLEKHTIIHLPPEDGGNIPPKHFNHLPNLHSTRTQMTPTEADVF